MCVLGMDCRVGELVSGAVLTACYQHLDSHRAQPRVHEGGCPTRSEEAGCLLSTIYIITYALAAFSK